MLLYLFTEQTFVEYLLCVRCNAEWHRGEGKNLKTNECDCYSSGAQYGILARCEETYK